MLSMTRLCSIESNDDTRENEMEVRQSRELLTKRSDAYGRAENIHFPHHLGLSHLLRIPVVASEGMTRPFDAHSPEFIAPDIHHP